MGNVASSTSIVLCAALTAAYGLLGLIKWWKFVQKLPPGPKKLPIIDNLLDMPTRLNSELFEKMANHYDTDIIHLGALGKSIVVLNSAKTARELLFKRSGIYSSRPESVTIEELCGWNWTFGLYTYGEKWREERRAFSKHMGVDGKIHYPNELYHARKLLGRLLENPDKFMDHIRHMTGAIFVSTAYGITVRSEDDPFVRLVEKGARMIGQLALEGPFLPDIWRFTRHIPSWIPGIQFKKIAREHQPVARDVLELPFEAARNLIKSGQSLPSLVSLGLEDLEQHGEDSVSIEKIKNVAGQIYIAGADTVTSSLTFGVLALVKYPRVQAKLQEEIDNALQGIGKLPIHSDIMSLPYLTAFVMEVLRWKPVTPIGVPHASTADDVYEGYFIPKGSVVIANQKAMLSNESDFPHPDEFKPERFLKDCKINEDVPSPIDIAFGFGRRICPGRHVALSTLMITFATVISNFELSKKKDAKGRVIEPADGYVEALARSSIPFECAINPRSSGAAESIRMWIASEESTGF